MVICWTEGIDTPPPDTVDRLFTARNALMTSRGAGGFTLWASSNGIVRNCLTSSFIRTGFVSSNQCRNGRIFPVTSSRNKIAVTNTGAFSSLPTVSSSSCTMILLCSSMRALSFKRRRMLFTRSTGMRVSSASVLASIAPIASNSLSTTRSNGFRPSPPSLALGKVTR